MALSNSPFHYFVSHTAAFITSGKIKPFIAKTFRLAEAAAVHRYMKIVRWEESVAKAIVFSGARAPRVETTATEES